MISAALTDVLEHPLAPLTSANAAFLAGGAAVYVLGIAAFRQAVAAAGGRLWWASIVAVVACAATFWLGALTAVAQVAAVVVVLFALAAVVHLPRRRVASSATEPVAVPR